MRQLFSIDLARVLQVCDFLTQDGRLTSITNYLNLFFPLEQYNQKKLYRKRKYDLFSLNDFVVYTIVFF